MPVSLPDYWQNRFRVASQGPAKTFIWVYSRDSSNLPQDIADLIHDKPSSSAEQLSGDCRLTHRVEAYSAPAMEPRASKQACDGFFSVHVTDKVFNSLLQPKPARPVKPSKESVRGFIGQHFYLTLDIVLRGTLNALPGLSRT